ncbi:hypothetical protein [Fervidobacterium thailandense]|uniref:Uncharacterized protein n=1 Tax=Fervidobacterium thailandense TaxID=1008305 RepID=A0A1E3G480_9BACT|nr:hypothetical protein [Fervidobacterium thailandense]ODN31091.1 hypothetical protein A4H02_02130 [Fervidobacterium thailandense]
MRKLGILLAVLLFGIFVYAQEVDVEGILNRLELLEEYANMIYETVGTKVGYEELEGLISDLDARISELEVSILNIQSTLETGLPAIRDMLYELSANIAAVEEKSAMYTDVRVDSLKEELDRLAEELASLQTLLEDVKVTLDIHDGDILKIYETLGSLSEELAGLQESVTALVSVTEDVESMKLKLDMHDQDIVNIYDNLAMKANLESVENLEASVTALEEAVNGLSEILTGLAAQIGDTDYLLRKQIENLGKNLESGLADKASKEEVEVLRNRLELLEDYASMIYDLANSKLSISDFEIFREEVEKTFSELRKTTTEKDQALEARIKATNELAEQAKSLAITGIVLGIAGIIISLFIK